MPDDDELLRRNHVSDQQDQIPAAAHPLPRISDIAYRDITGQPLDLAGPGPWQLTGHDHGLGGDVTTVWDGPLSGNGPAAQLAASYPGVKVWRACPARIDETCRDAGQAARRIAGLLGVEMSTARAILTIAADDVLGFRFTWGRWEITGDDQTFRIRTVNPGPETVLVPVSREQARLVVPVLRDWANDGEVTVACLGVASAIDQAVTGNDPTGGTRGPGDGPDRRGPLRHL